MAVAFQRSKCKGIIINCGHGCCGDLHFDQPRKDVKKLRRKVRRVNKREFSREVAYGNY